MPNDPKNLVDPRVWERHRQDKDDTGGCGVRVEVLESEQQRRLGEGQGEGARHRHPDQRHLHRPADTIRPGWKDAFPAGADTAGARA
ncbi:hypothetical protein WKI65_43015 [Streptomyces sp. MS1.AVA.3]|uniref:hypothetical protein n=1 Tax=Streptomyces decoyicus TaxID=249567 RepID=UPI0030C60832